MCAKAGFSRTASMRIFRGPEEPQISGIPQSGAGELLKANAERYGQTKHILYFLKETVILRVGTLVHRRRVATP